MFLSMSICCICVTHVAFVLAADRFNMTTEFQVSLEFRTVKEEGILLTASSSNGDNALALEIIGGKASDLSDLAVDITLLNKFKSLVLIISC
jgi:hypothetical protein